MYFPFSTTALLLLLGEYACALTNFTGEVIGGYPVITSLDLADTPSNAITRYWLRAAEAQGGIPYFLPVFVARGTEESLRNGTKLSLSSSIHGDELNPIAVVQRVFKQLNETVSGGQFNGTVIGLPTANPNGNQHNQRNFYSSSEGGFLTNLNRIFPGEDPLEGASLPSGYVYAIWNNLWGNSSNVDIAVDMRMLRLPPYWQATIDSRSKALTSHPDTPTISEEGPLWCYADFRLPGVRRLAELAQPDIIKIDPGQPGSIETTFVENSIPAITLEIGAAKSWSQELIQRTVDYIFRLLADQHMTPSSSGGSAPVVDLNKTFKGTDFSSNYATSTGWVQKYVNVLDDVTEGQLLATVYNSWGDVIENITSEVNGRVLQLRYDAAVEQGGRIVQMAYNDTSN